jgi:lipopolysaccharide biosynthesis glycosyltransferase
MTSPPIDAAPKACVCYVVDEGYLFPTLVSAIQARANVSPTMADIIIACIGALSDKAAFMRSLAASYGIVLISVPAARINNLHPMFGRLFLDGFLPPQYERVLYIDGDTQVAGDLTPLLTIDFPLDEFLACRDPAITFGELKPSWKAKHLQHCETIGFTGDPADYFNSGMLVINRQGWGEIAHKCLNAYFANEALFKYPDQDALNVAAGHQCQVISNKWNFPGFLIGSPADTERQPHIYHFMSNPRPWKAAVAPWGQHWAKPYREILIAHPELEAIAPPRERRSQLKYMLQQRIKMLSEYGPVGRLTSEVDVKAVA